MKKRKQSRLETFVSVVIAIAMLPLLITVFWQRMESERLLGVLDEQRTEEIYEQSEAMEQTSELDSEEAMYAEQIESLLPGIVAKEIEMSAPQEAIKAQCVIARTNLLLARQNGKEDPESFTIEQMQEAFGTENFSKIYQQLEEYIQLTQNEVLLWEGDYIDAEYHAISAGMTRNLSETIADADIPYLQSVTCKDDMSATSYLSVHYWDEDEFVKECKELFPDAAWGDSGEILLEESTKEDCVAVKTRDSAGYVLTMQMGKTEITGDAFRSAFELNSSNFSISKEDDKIRVITKGVGHGYGLSQNTAIQMAEDGSTYKEILSFFFPYTELTNSLN